MEDSGNLKSKTLYKYTINLLRILPIFMVLSYLLMLICFYYSPRLIIIPHIIGTVGVPLAFIYITSYVFRFCAFHRVFIHYYAFINILNVSHHYFSDILDPNIVTIIHESGSLIFTISAIILYIRKCKTDKQFKSNNNNNVLRNSQ